MIADGLATGPSEIRLAVHALSLATIKSRRPTYLDFFLKIRFEMRR